MKKPLPEVSISAIWVHYGGELVGRDASLWRKAKCPIHDDRNASASVNEDEGKWSCWTCDLHGDAFDLIQRMEPGELGLHAAASLAEGIAGSGNGQIRSERPRSSLLPGRQGHRPGRGNWSPPWSRL